jgi:hypothetical protein
MAFCGAGSANGTGAAGLARNEADGRAPCADAAFAPDAGLAAVPYACFAPGAKPVFVRCAVPAEGVVPDVARRRREGSAGVGLPKRAGEVVDAA